MLKLKKKALQTTQRGCSTRTLSTFKQQNDDYFCRQCKAIYMNEPNYAILNAILNNE